MTDAQSQLLRGRRRSTAARARLLAKEVDDPRRWTPGEGCWRDEHDRDAGGDQPSHHSPVTAKRQRPWRTFRQAAYRASISRRASRQRRGIRVQMGVTFRRVSFPIPHDGSALSVFHARPPFRPWSKRHPTLSSRERSARMRRSAAMVPRMTSSLSPRFLAAEKAMLMTSSTASA